MPIPDHIQRAIQAYFAERATPDDIAALEDWLRADEAHIRLFAELGMVEWQMLCELERLDSAAVLAMLLESERNAQPDYTLIRKPAPEPSPAHPAAPTVTARDLASVAAYLAGCIAKKAVRNPAALAGSIAAVLLFAAVVYIELFGLPNTSGPTTTAHPTLAEPHNEPGRVGPENPTPAPTPAPAQAVATLTNTHNATWAPAPGSRPGPAASAARANPSKHPPTPGTPLHPGQRLTLTHGFAEITTNDGAIAILEAPATIELLDNDNALRLESGKLVGICETPSSKGFLVRTPHMDITDLGTEFGVEVTKRELTTTVFTGEVELITPDGASLLLSANQTAHLSRDDSNPTPIVAEDRIAIGFTRQMPNLFGSAILAIDFNSATSPTQRGFVGQSRLDQTHETRLGAIRVAVSNQSKSDESWDRYPVTRLEGTAADLYRDFIFQNTTGESLTLTLSGEGVKPNSAYRLTFYSHDSLDGGRASTVRPSDGTTGPTIGPLGAGARPVTLDQYAGAGTFVADASGKLTFSIGNTNGQSCLNGFSITPSTGLTD